MRKLLTFLMAGSAVIAMPALAAPQASAPANTGTTTASTPESSPTTSTADAPASSTASAPAATSTNQTAAASGNVAVGSTVKDTSGGTVGTIESVDGQYAVLATAKSKVRLPLSSFGKGTDGPILAMTQAQVDAAASAAAKTAKP